VWYVKHKACNVTAGAKIVWIAQDDDKNRTAWTKMWLCAVNRAGWSGLASGRFINVN
jgi:hypothetical protein